MSPVGLARLGARVLLLAGLAAVAFVAVTFVQVRLAAQRDHAPAADAIVVLGAAQWDGKPSPVLQARLDHAVELWRGGVAPVVVVTGGNQPGDRVTQGFAGYQELRDQGLPDEAIRVEVDGHDTYTELSAAANILRGEDLGLRVVLVTDPYHSLRAGGIGAEVGLSASVSPTDSSSSVRDLVRETAAVAAGRVVGFRRLSNWTS